MDKLKLELLMCLLLKDVRTIRCRSKKEAKSKFKLLKQAYNDLPDFLKPPNQ